MPIHRMRIILFALLAFLSLACSIDSTAVSTTAYEPPTRNHDLGYIPHDTRYDHPDYIVCDSTKINSGRNSVQYAEGTKKLREDILVNYSYNPAYAAFSGYIVIRFLVNCEGNTGRYRAQALNLDFTSADAPDGLLEQSIALLKSLDQWVKSSKQGKQAEYAKYINLKMENGHIQHILL